MREILFRGKDLDGIWREGYYWSCDNKCHRIFTGKLKLVGVTIIPEMFSVIPETVGQYTGLTANGTKIFEGDILQYRNKYCGDRVLGYMEYGAYNCGCCHTVYGFSLCSNPDEEGKNDMTAQSLEKTQNSTPISLSSATFTIIPN